MKKSTKVLLCVIGIFLVTSILIGISYAFYIFSVSQSGSNVVRTDCFEITYTDGNAINLTSTIPLSEEEASSLTPYSFTINNICNNAIDYNINIETLNTTTMDLNAVRVKLDNKASKIFGSIESNDSSTYFNDDVASSKTIFTGSMKANSSKTFNLKAWIDEDSTKEQAANKIFESKVVVSTTLNPNYSEAVLASGTDFNVAIKTLAGEDDSDINTSVSSITAIQRSLTAPLESDNAIDVADATSDKPIYAWFDSGTIKIYCENDNIFLGGDSSYMFNGLYKVSTIDVSYFDTSRVENMSYMFGEMTSLTNLNVSNFDTSNVINMSYMFSELGSVTQLDISNFNTSNVKNMSGMFNEVHSLTNLDVSSFDTSKVEDMSSMFDGMINLSSLDVSHFDTSNVVNMSGMFASLDLLESIDVSHFDTSKVEDMSWMFFGMSNISSLDLSCFDTSNVKNTSTMFNGMSKLTTIYIGNSWSIENVTSSSSMFSQDTKLVGGAGTAYDSNHTDKEYARVDDPTNGKPGYFTLKTS